VKVLAILTLVTGISVLGAALYNAKTAPTATTAAKHDKKKKSIDKKAADGDPLPVCPPFCDKSKKP
jgi:hypothetical protein